MKKRLFALLLVLSYAVSLLPLAALAEGDAPAENTPDVKVEVVLASEDGGSAPVAPGGDTQRPGADQANDAGYIYVEQKEHSEEVEILAGTPEDNKSSEDADEPTEGEEGEEPADGEEGEEGEEGKEPADGKEENPSTQPKPDQNWDVFYDKDDGTLYVTYRIKKDAEADELTLDLTQVMAVLNAYADETGNVIDYNEWEPGDSAKFCINIVTESGHTYRYKDGSFVLQTPDQGGSENGTGIHIPASSEPEEGTSSDGTQEKVVGFDSQNLTEQYKGESVFQIGIHAAPERVQNERDPGPIEVLYGKLFYNIDPSTRRASEKPDEDTFYLDNASFKSMYQMNISYNLSYAEYAKLNNYLNGKYETSTLEDGLKAYLVEWYSDKDQTEYADFDDMMKSSETALFELYGGTQGSVPHYIEVKNSKALKVTNTMLFNAIVADKGGSTSTGNTKFLALQALINEKCSTNFPYKTTSDWTKLRSDLISMNCNDLANLMPTSYSANNLVTAYLKIFEARDGGSACQEYLKIQGYNPEDFDVQEDTAINGLPSANALISKPVAPVECPCDLNTRYDNFYKNLISFVYGTKETVENVTGAPERKDTSLGTLTGADGKTYTTYPDNLLYAVLDGIGYMTYDENRGLLWDDADANKVAFIKVGNEYVPVIDKDLTTVTRTEYANDNWSSANLAATIGDYMKNETDGAWDNANDFFNELLGRGISAADSLEKANQMYNTLRARGIEPDDAAGVAFYMAFNLDGPLTGNRYQNTKWEWYNAIQLERMDYPVTITKTDEKDNVITEECQFQLWYYGDGTSTESTGTKSYLVQKADADGNLLYHDEEKTKPVCVFVTEEEANQQGIKNLTLTIQGSATIDYAMMKDMIYFLQEKVAPKGYELDATIRVICEDEETYNEVKKNFSDGDKNELMYAGSLTAADGNSTGTQGSNGTSGGYVLEIRVANPSSKKTTPPRKTPQLRAAPAPMEEVEIIPDEVPLAYPTTGDTMFLWVSMELISAAALVTLFTLKKRAII